MRKRIYAAHVKGFLPIRRPWLLTAVVRCL